MKIPTFKIPNIGSLSIVGSKAKAFTKSGFFKAPNVDSGLHAFKNSGLVQNSHLRGLGDIKKNQAVQLSNKLVKVKRFNKIQGL